tara:strand:+ start:4958 stop:5419 length:462 start_codon:yes stop_codon:yes gene_type:complete
MDGIKHLIECQCILPQYKKIKDPPYHKFVVFSIVDDVDNVLEKFAQCNNCGIVHRVFDICRSEIATGHESLSSLPTKEDFSLMLPSSVADILNSYDCELYIWEQVSFILNHEKVNEKIVITKDEIKGKVQGKFLTYIGNNRFNIEPFVADTEL